MPKSKTVKPTAITKESEKYLDIVWKTFHDWYIKLAEHTPSIIAGVIIFLLFMITSRYLSTLSVKFFQKIFPKKKTEIISLIGLFRFLIVMTGTFLALEIVGLSGFLWKFIGSLGVAGIIAGVALQSLATSIFSGLLVSIDKSFKVGDYVTIENFSGTVHDVGFLTTKLITDDGKKVYIPNQLIFSAPFFNITDSPQRKIILDFEIANTENLDNVKTVLLNEVKTFNFAEQSENAEVVFIGQKLGVYNLQVKFSLKQGENPSSSKSQAIVSIKQKLDSEGIKTSNPTVASTTPTS